MSENVLKQIPKELWWKIFFILFSDLNKIKQNKLETNKEFTPPYTPFEFPNKLTHKTLKDDDKFNVKIERNNLLSTISNTCSFWKEITIKNKTFTNLFFEQHTQEFDGVKLVLNKDKYLNVNHKMKVDELNMKLEEITSFRDNDEECIIKRHHHRREIIKSDLNPKLNEQNNVIFIDNNNDNFVNQIQNIYTNVDGIDIEAVEERFREQYNIYKTMLEEDEKCKERHIIKSQTDEEYIDQENLQKKSQSIPTDEFEDKIETLIKEREQSLFSGFIDNTITYYNTQGDGAFL
jgi:hypothetical protein